MTMSFDIDDAREALESFLDEGLIAEILFELKSGKEATVYCCRAGDVPGSLIAAKVYRPLESRRFRNDAIYQTGRVHLAREGRALRAAQNKTAFGRELQYAMWLEHEWETMRLLFESRLDIPRPLARNDRAILMPYLGDERGPAPNLAQAELRPNEVDDICNRLLWNIEAMLDLDRVHGDLSPFNVLYWNGEPIIIDFPQAVDPRLNPSAAMLLGRDVDNICDWARKRGGQHRDSKAMTVDLWSRFAVGELG